VYTFYTLFY